MLHVRAHFLALRLLSALRPLLARCCPALRLLSLHLLARCQIPLALPRQSLHGDRCRSRSRLRTRCDPPGEAWVPRLVSRCWPRRLSPVLLPPVLLPPPLLLLLLGGVMLYVLLLWLLVLGGPQLLQPAASQLHGESLIPRHHAVQPIQQLAIIEGGTFQCLQQLLVQRLIYGKRGADGAAARGGCRRRRLGCRIAQQQPAAVQAGEAREGAGDLQTGGERAGKALVEGACARCTRRTDATR